jgi:RND superfamily putative drug exporter
MRLLGSANWYFPRWLQWLPDLRVEAGEPAHAPAGAAGTPAGDIAVVPPRAAARGLIAATEAD